VSDVTTEKSQAVKAERASGAGGASGIAAGGMIPKIKCCQEAIAQGVAKAHIIDGRRFSNPWSCGGHGINGQKAANFS